MRTRYRISPRIDRQIDLVFEVIFAALFIYYFLFTDEVKSLILVGILFLMCRMDRKL
jgi:hypothetical protein